MFWPTLMLLSLLSTLAIYTSSPSIPRANPTSAMFSTHETNVETSGKNVIENELVAVLPGVFSTAAGMAANGATERDVGIKGLDEWEEGIRGDVAVYARFWCTSRSSEAWQ
ncbi:hypothetical protein PtrM4_124510 [Pyrenophora tritici-repentis]|uniref:Uncharacterized protein n=1 Tax=Pyrenophora tritici-repentis TaxID=45151 RepID=A0A834RPP6_9PLEO|nr:hypothetical protein PtrM4_124510 [Pyrenophora tritici-repentis]